MAGTLPKRCYALDTNVPLDLADNVPAAHTLLQVCRERNYLLTIPPTVVQELTLLVLNQDHPATQLASIALSNLKAWGIVPFDLQAVNHGIAERFAQKVMDEGIVPEGEFNDAVIVAEVATYEIPVLVTSDGDLRNASPERLQRALEQCCLSPVRIMPPWTLVREFAQTASRP